MNITSPIYLLRSSASCWACGSMQEVVALACLNWDDDDYDESSADYDNEPVLLNYIESMPPEILEYILAKHPQFEDRESKTAGSSYFMNICSCGAHFGDFFLHSKPGGAFFPTTEAEAQLISIEELPVSGVLDFDCGYGIGNAAFIFKYAK